MKKLMVIEARTDSEGLLHNMCRYAIISLHPTGGVAVYGEGNITMEFASDLNSLKAFAEEHGADHIFAYGFEIRGL